MAQSAHQQAVQEELARKARHAWFQARIEQIHRTVSAYDVLLRHGVSLKGSGAREEQFSCPFHGVDRKPSARFYPESARSPSHAWCFVCQERWDAIALWRKFNGGETSTFSRALSEIERTFGLEVPDQPEDMAKGRPKDSALEEFDTILAACEGRLRTAKTAYRKLDDMMGYLSASSIIDKVSFRVDERILTPAQGTEALRRLMDKIGEKIRACPDG